MKRIIIIMVFFFVLGCSPEQITNTTIIINQTNHTEYVLNQTNYTEIEYVNTTTYIINQTNFTEYIEMDECKADLVLIKRIQYLEAKYDKINKTNCTADYINLTREYRLLNTSLIDCEKDNLNLSQNCWTI